MTQQANHYAPVYGPLTSDNAAHVLVDDQVGLMTDVRDYSTGELKHNVVALARATRMLKVPTIATTKDNARPEAAAVYGAIEYNGLPSAARSLQPTAGKRGPS
jgi:hypothetical protein